MSNRLLAAIAALLAAAGDQEHHPDASVVLTPATADLQEVKDAHAEADAALTQEAAETDARAFVKLVGTVLSCFAQEKPDGDATKVQLAAGHFDALKKAVTPQAEDDSHLA